MGLARPPVHWTGSAGGHAGRPQTVTHRGALCNSCRSALTAGRVGHGCAPQQGQKSTQRAIMADLSLEDLLSGLEEVQAKKSKVRQS